MLILEPVAVTQGDDYSEVGLLPLRGVERSAGTLGPLHTLLDDDLRLRKSADGYDGVTESRCQNLWNVYAAMRSPPRSAAARRVNADRLNATADPPAAAATCTFGAPLVATALQRIGALDRRVDPSRATPASIAQLRLTPPAAFSGAVGVRSGPG